MKVKWWFAFFFLVLCFSPLLSFLTVQHLGGAAFRWFSSGDAVVFLLLPVMLSSPSVRGVCVVLPFPLLDPDLNTYSNVTELN